LPWLLVTLPAGFGARAAAPFFFTDTGVGRKQPVCIFSRMVTFYRPPSPSFFWIPACKVCNWHPSLFVPLSHATRVWPYFHTFFFYTSQITVPDHLVSGNVSLQYVRLFFGVYTRVVYAVCVLLCPAGPRNNVRPPRLPPPSEGRTLFSHGPPFTVFFQF